MNYSIVEKYVDLFAKEIQSQPSSNNEYEPCKRVYDEFLSDLQVESVLEVGAGVAPLLSLFPESVKKTGLSMGKERPEYIDGDMNTPPFQDKTYDLVLARHCVEHSLMPLIMLCELERVAKKYVLIVVPSCNEEIAEMINHYAVFTPISWRALFKKANMTILKEKLDQQIYAHDPNTLENWFLLCPQK